MSVEQPLITLSIVSHGQSAMVANLFYDLNRLPTNDFEVILTFNVPEETTIYLGNPFSVQIIRNIKPRGFGANHNAAFTRSRGRYFAVVNPDIRIPALDIDCLVQLFERAEVGAVAPMILSSKGNIEDSARRFPTFSRLLRRVIFNNKQPDYTPGNLPIDVDWVGGMFIIFRPDSFRALGGFDEKRFFMYYEDVDICRRLWLSGWQVYLHPQASVVHQAQRASHRNFKHLRWHLTSAIRYLSNF